MAGLQIRQGTIYRKRDDGSEFVLINHNPMQLQSLRIHQRAGDWDCSTPELLAVDTLIEIRKSGEFDELGDMESNEFKALLDKLIAAGSLPEDHLELVRKI